MSITVPCPACQAQRRPHTVCGCGAAVDTAADGSAWRAAARDRYGPRVAGPAPALALEAMRLPRGPRRVVVTLPAETTEQPAPIVPLHGPDPDEARSFDWGRGGRLPRLRRVA